ncbi:ImmA/IrrE family metallo-endopeptidase [Microbacter sp. GSS18]|nr:ImmA/IrrE family metallo-endopeptidase [Microbacter sp. GSS18]
MTSSALEVFSDHWSASSPEAAMIAAAEHAAADFSRFPPIDPGAVAARFGASVSVAPGQRRADGSLADHGQLTVRESRWHIRVPKELSIERRRFSVAHEIGHILLFSAVADQPTLVRQLRGKATFADVERLCNLGAAHVLMPTGVVAETLRTLLPPTGKSVEALATRFRVSLEAAARRIVEVSPEWSVIFWELSTTHPRGQAWRTSGQHQRDDAPYLPPGQSSSRRLQPDVVAEAALRGEASAAKVLANLEGVVATMRDVSAWYVPRARHELLEVADDRARHREERVFLFYKADDH